METVAPAPETLQEVKVQTSLYDASTGRSGGGNFQLITQGGGNDLHGSLYWFVQNEAFAANEFFFNRDGIEKPRARRNEWGGTVGGPIRRDKAFFFFGYHRTDAETAFVPTGSAMSDLPLALNTITGARTAGALAAAFGIPVGQVSPVGLALNNLINPVTGNFAIPAPGTGPIRAPVISY